MACFLATLTGALVLAVLLGSVVVAVLSRPPDHPWYDLPAHLHELFGFVAALVTRPRSSDPARAGFMIGIAGSLWLLGLVTSYTLGGFIHVLLVIAIVMVLIRVIQGRNPLGG